jgi:ABC-type transport system substrate-binding protein
MISPTAAEKNGVECAYHHPVGTGPFKFKGFQRDVFLEDERFDNYWGASHS